MSNETEEQVCFNCGRDSIGYATVGSPLELCREHFNLAMIAGWKPVLRVKSELNGEQV